MRWWGGDYRRELHETIGNLLYDYGEKFILSALEDGIILSIKDPVFGHKEC